MSIELSAGAPSPGASRPPLPPRERIEVRVTPRWKFGETTRAANNTRRTNEFIRLLTVRLLAGIRNIAIRVLIDIVSAKSRVDEVLVGNHINRSQNQQIVRSERSVDCIDRLFVLSTVIYSANPRTVNFFHVRCSVERDQPGLKTTGLVGGNQGFDSCPNLG